MNIKWFWFYTNFFLFEYLLLFMFQLFHSWLLLINYATWYYNILLKFDEWYIKIWVKWIAILHPCFYTIGFRSLFKLSGSIRHLSLIRMIRIQQIWKDCNPVAPLRNRLNPALVEMLFLKRNMNMEVFAPDRNNSEDNELVNIYLNRSFNHFEMTSEWPSNDLWSLRSFVIWVI